jgi:hypothetical protein
MRRKSFWVAAIVVAAFAGAAVAARGSVAHLISGKEIAPNSIQSSRLVDHTIQARDLSPSLLRSFRGGKGPPGPPGKDGKDGKGGVSAYGFVVPGEVSLNVNPVLVDARSHNIDRVTSPAAGVFCLTLKAGIDAASRSWTVTPEKSRSTVASNLMFAYADTGIGTCPAGQLAVRTYELNITKLGAAAAPSEHVAFMVVIP